MDQVGAVAAGKNRDAVRPLPVGVAPTIVTAALYVFLLAITTGERGLAGHAHVGRYFGLFPEHAHDPIGYDGQLFLFIAADPFGAAEHMDAPAYRYGRILYPLVARVIAFGNDDWLFAALIGVNVVAVLVATFMLARHLVDHRVSPWWALAFSLFPGLWFAVNFDLSEPLAYSLAAIAMTQFRRRPWAAAGVLAAAALTRETTLLFGLAVAAATVRTDRRRAAAFLAIAAGPYVAWRLVVYLSLGSWGNAEATAFELVPFGGAIGQHWLLVLLIAAPALLAVAVVVVRGSVSAQTVALVLSVLVLVVFLPRPSWGGYAATGRISTGVVLAFLLCLPQLRRRGIAALTPVMLWQCGWLLELPHSPP
jgi:hypothetical protein